MQYFGGTCDMARDTPRAIFYMDPPYQARSSYTVGAFDHVTFWRYCTDLSRTHPRLRFGRTRRDTS